MNAPKEALPVAPARQARRGHGRVTLQDVARAAGVTSITVSRYLREPEVVAPDTAGRIREALAETGYVPNKQAGLLASGRSNMVAALLPNLAQWASGLIDNALSYGGMAQVFLQDEGASVTVLVDDGGPGIPPEELERVFEPFHRLDGSRNRRTGGIGLGLAIVRQAIIREGATVELLNRPEGGLRAKVVIPRRSMGASERPGTRQRGRSDRMGGGRLRGTRPGCALSA